MTTIAKKTTINRQKVLRHKLQEHRRLQSLSSSIYLKYCSLTGFLHVLPNFLIIGFVKCGTTSLYEYLIQHPSVYAPTGKEIDYFDRFHKRGNNWYKNKFPLQIQKFLIKNFYKKNFVTGEATPRYIEHPHALKRIKKTLPNAKFIVLLRNPIDRAYSHYNQNIHLDYEYRSFEDAIAHEQERIRGRYQKMQDNENYYSWDFDIYAYLQHGIYATYLERWLQEFPKEQFFITSSEEFLKDTKNVYNKVLKFLNLSNFELSDYQRFKQREYKNPNINDNLRKQLVDFFRPHNERLYNLLDTKFDWDK